MILVIIIVAAWIVILAPSLIKRRSQSLGEIGSISHFHRQLRVLEHSGPEPIVTPAYRLRAVDGGGGTTQASGRPEAAVPVLSVVGASQLPRPALAFLGDDPVKPGGGSRADQPRRLAGHGRRRPGSDWSSTPPPGDGRGRACRCRRTAPGPDGHAPKRASVSASAGVTPSP